MKPLHEEMWNIVLDPNMKTYFVDLFPGAVGHNRNLKIKNAALPKNLNDHRSCCTTISLVNAEGSDIDTLNQPLVLCTLVPMIWISLSYYFGLLLNSEACYILVEGPNPVNICMQAISSTKQRTDVIDHARTQLLSSSLTSSPLEAKGPNANSETLYTSRHRSDLALSASLGDCRCLFHQLKEPMSMLVTNGARTPQSTHNKRQSLSSSYNSSPSGIATKGPNVNGPGNMKARSQPFPLKSSAVDSRSHETKTNSTLDGAHESNLMHRVLIEFQDLEPFAHHCMCMIHEFTKGKD
ncbi:hypothetical protein EV359DRAFT_68029 [Lentinula novae-zelandiae]|nr:hypothetical protein EV359DRAFT_68029 [Lentinula novae-zelandiae]